MIFFTATAISLSNMHYDSPLWSEAVPSSEIGMPGVGTAISRQSNAHMATNGTILREVCVANLAVPMLRGDYFLCTFLETLT